MSNLGMILRVFSLRSHCIKNPHLQFGIPDHEMFNFGHIFGATCFFFLHLNSTACYFLPTSVWATYCTSGPAVKRKWLFIFVRYLLRATHWFLVCQVEESQTYPSNLVKIYLTAFPWHGKKANRNLILLIYLFPILF